MTVQELTYENYQTKSLDFRWDGYFVTSNIQSSNIQSIFISSGSAILWKPKFPNRVFLNKTNLISDYESVTQS